MVKFAEVINASVEWTGTVLLRPFSPKKWLILTFIALWAGTMTGGGCNLNLSEEVYKGKAKEAEAQVVSEKKEPAQALKQALQSTLLQLKSPAAKIYLVTAIFLLLALLLLVAWLYARFSFVFLESVVKNDASIKIPFKENKALGNSLFLFYLAMAGVYLLLLGAIIGGCIFTLFRMGIFESNSQIGPLKLILTLSPFIGVFLLLMLIYAIVYLIVCDFIIIVMFKDKIKLAQAWPKVAAILGTHKMDLIKYILIKAGLGLCAWIILGIVSFVIILGLLLPIGLMGAIFYAVYLIIPQALHTFTLVIMVLIALPVLLFLIYGLICVSLPPAVFFRTFSLKFMGRLNQGYNLFALGPETEVIP